MPLSNYPAGFNNGVLIKETLNTDTVAGKIFYVGNNTTSLVNEKGAADTASAGTFLRPFNTINYAITQCAADRGDVIFVRPGHAETIATAAGIAANIANVSIVGLGNGEDRPIITFATSTAATIVISAANVRWSNFVFKCNIASQTTMFTVAATDVQFDGCAFREGSATGIAFVTVGSAANDSDRFKMTRCEFWAPTAGNYANGLLFHKNQIQVRLDNIKSHGNFSTANITVDSTGNAQKNFIIENSYISNLTTNTPAISVNSTTNTGAIINSTIKTDTRSTAISSGGLSISNVNWADLSTANVMAVPVAASAVVNGGAVGSTIVVTKTLTSSAIVTGGVDITTLASGSFVIQQITACTDASTGLAAATNLQIVKNGGNGAVLLLAEAISNLGGAKTTTMTAASVTTSASAVIESGFKLQAKATVTNCTGAGTITIYITLVRTTDGATITNA